MTRRIRALALICLGTSLLVSQAWALTNEFYGNLYLSANAGRSYYVMDGGNNINACSGLPPDHYFRTSIHDGSFVGITGGYSWTRYDTMFPAIMVGLNFTYGFNGEISGKIEKYSLSNFTNYDYSYDFGRQSLMAVVKLNVFNYFGFMPYLTTGAGISYNRASNYDEDPLNGVTPRVSPGFDTNYHSSRAYMVGAGIDYTIRDDIWVGLGYQYGDFGVVSTGNGEVQITSNKDYRNDHLKNKLRANSVSLEFTYLINYV